MWGVGVGRGTQKQGRRQLAQESATAGAPSGPDTRPADGLVSSVRGRPGPRSAPALDDLITHLIADGTVTEPTGTGPFSTVVDVALGAQRLAGWALWVELAAIARL